MQIVQWFESVLLIFSLLFTSISGFLNGTNKDAQLLREKTDGLPLRNRMGNNGFKRRAQACFLCN